MSPAWLRHNDYRIVAVEWFKDDFLSSSCLLQKHCPLYRRFLLSSPLSSLLIAATLLDLLCCLFAIWSCKAPLINNHTLIIQQICQTISTNTCNECIKHVDDPNSLNSLIIKCSPTNMCFPQSTIENTIFYTNVKLEIEMDKSVRLNGSFIFLIPK